MAARRGPAGVLARTTSMRLPTMLDSKGPTPPAIGGRDDTATDHQAPHGQRPPAWRYGATAPARPPRPRHHPCQASAAPTTAAERQQRSTISCALDPPR